MFPENQGSAPIGASYLLLSDCDLLRFLSEPFGFAFGAPWKTPSSFRTSETNSEFAAKGASPRRILIDRA